ncbi:MAG: integrase core domain-containing protein [Lachnospiraceae bacterium]
MGLQACLKECEYEVFASYNGEDIYINEYNTPKELRHGIRDFVEQYNTERPHAEHGGDYPCEAYAGHFVA